MDSKKQFEQSQQELESAYGEFNEFYEKMDDFFKQREVLAYEVGIIEAIRELATTLDRGRRNPKFKKGEDPEEEEFLGYESWTGDELTRADGRLATLLLNLGEIASRKAQKANALGRWVKWKKHNEWNPAKQALEKSLKKFNKDDVEAEVGKKIFAENVMEAMLAGHADHLLNMFESCKSILTALAHRINLKKAEQGLTRRGIT